MTTTTTTRTPDADAAELHRLAGLAHVHQVWLYREPTGAWRCTSATDPQASYYVTGLSCTCRAYARSQRCIHHALLLDRLGWLPPMPATTHQLGTEPTPIARRTGAPLLAAAALALVLVASITTAPDTTAKPRHDALIERADIVVNAGTDDAAIRLPGAPVPIQAEYLSTYLLHRDDPALTIFEDGSLSLDDR